MEIPKPPLTLYDLAKMEVEKAAKAFELQQENAAKARKENDALFAYVAQGREGWKEAVISSPGMLAVYQLRIAYETQVNVHHIQMSNPPQYGDIFCNHNTALNGMHIFQSDKLP